MTCQCPFIPLTVRDKHASNANREPAYLDLSQSLYHPFTPSCSFTCHRPSLPNISAFLKTKTDWPTGNDGGHTFRKDNGAPFVKITPPKGMLGPVFPTLTQKRAPTVGARMACSVSQIGSAECASRWRFGIIRILF